MTDNKPLYQDSKLKIEFLPNSTCDHALYFMDDAKTEPDLSYLLPRGVLENFAKAPVDNLERMVDTLNFEIPIALKKKGISIEYLGAACTKAHMEYLKRVDDFRQES